jgi:phage shock protein C
MGYDLDRPLKRSSTNKMLSGVCGGLANWLGWDPTVVRVLFCVASVASAAFPGLIIYLALTFIIPQD